MERNEESEVREGEEEGEGGRGRRRRRNRQGIRRVGGGRGREGEEGGGERKVTLYLYAFHICETKYSPDTCIYIYTPQTVISTFPHKPLHVCPNNKIPFIVAKIYTYITSFMSVYSYHNRCIQDPPWVQLVE